MNRKEFLEILRSQRGAVGQVGGVKIALGLGQVDANAAQNARPCCW